MTFEERFDRCFEELDEITEGYNRETGNAFYLCVIRKDGFESIGFGSEIVAIGASAIVDAYNRNGRLTPEEFATKIKGAIVEYLTGEENNEHE